MFFIVLILVVLAGTILVYAGSYIMFFITNPYMLGLILVGGLAYWIFGGDTTSVSTTGQIVQSAHPLDTSVWNVFVWAITLPFKIIVWVMEFLGWLLDFIIK